jgi:Flp pilus assembly protein CpaB
MEKNKRRSVVFLGIAILLALVAGVIFASTLAQLQQDLKETESVVVAKKDIRAGYAYGSYFKSLEDIVGPLARDQFGNLLKDESGNFTDRNLTDNAVALIDFVEGDLIQADGVDKNAGLMPNMRAVSISVNRVQSVGGSVRTGNRVDVLVSYMQEVEGGETGTEQEPMTEVLFQDVEVLAVSFLAPTEEVVVEGEEEEKAVGPESPGPARFLPSGELMDEATVTLALPLEDAVKLTYMANFGQEVRLVIRRLDEREAPEIQSVTVDSFR